MTKGDLLQEIRKTQSTTLHWHGNLTIFSTNSWFVTTANTASLKPSSSADSTANPEFRNSQLKSFMD